MKLKLRGLYRTRDGSYLSLRFCNKHYYVFTNIVTGDRFTIPVKKARFGWMQALTYCGALVKGRAPNADRFLRGKP